MRFNEMPSSFSYAVTSILLFRPIAASFLPEQLFQFEDLQNVQKRCANPCGYYGQLCCQSNEVCYTDANNQAQCGAAAGTTQTVAQSAAGGSWEYYTTTYVETDLQTVTATFSSYVSSETLSCSYSSGETACGSCCCLSGQFCESDGNCVANGGGSSGYYSSLFTTTTIVTNTANAPLRPTSNSVVTLTSTGSATTTQPFITPVGTDGSIITGAQSSSKSSGLSGGAIAGIVIGVILGIIILLLICACCCFKGLLDGLLAIFGLGPRSRRRTEETYIEERHSRRNGGGGRTWFGRRPGREEEVIEEKRTSGWTRGASVAAVLGGLALILGLKRRRDRREEDKSSVSYDSYYDYSASSSESVSDRRTRRTSRSRSRASGR